MQPLYSYQRKQAKSKAAAFWARVHKRRGGTCWPWVGRRSKAGYGRIGGEGAHRRAWRLARGPIPDGLEVLHRCDNPPCCNPAHLFLGTPLDNALDAKAKGRTRGGKPRRPNFPADVRAEVARMAAAGDSRAEIATATGMSERNVYNVLRSPR